MKAPIRSLLLVLILVIAISGCSHFQKDKDILFQASTINALLEGVYDGDITYEVLKKHGDFGIGTFNALDGEMIGFGGKFYQVKTNGIAYPVGNSQKTPFAVVTFFDPDKTVSLDNPIDLNQLEKYLDSLLLTKNIFYAIKIEGDFKYVKTRSVPRQQKPYPRLVEVVKQQTVFEFHNVKGTIAGFWMPAYIKGINVPAYHLHFLTEDRKSGGHLLACQLKDVEIEIDYTSNLYLVLNKQGKFYKVDLTKEKQTELEKVEKDRKGKK